MPRIADKKNSQLAQTNTNAQEEVTQVQAQEESQAAESAETSFFAADVTEGSSPQPTHKREKARAVGLSRPFFNPPGAKLPHALFDRERPGAGKFYFDEEPLHHGVRDESLRPQLQGLHDALQMLRAMPDHLLMEQGFDKPLLLETVDLGLLRRALVSFRASHPKSPFTAQLRHAWEARIEAKMYTAVQKLNALTQGVRELNRGVAQHETFFAMWDKQGDSLRSLASDQLLAARQGAKMGLGETYFYQECLAALDEHALEMALAKRRGTVPDESSLRRLAARLEDTAQLGDLDWRLEAARARALSSEASLVGEAPQS